MIKIIKTEEIVEATCDICGGDCMKDFYLSEGDHDDRDNIKEFEGMKLKADWGFMSNKDGEEWEAIVCEECVDKHLTNLIKFLKTPHN